jgi:hypothetical protein
MAATARIVRSVLNLGLALCTVPAIAQHEGVSAATQCTGATSVVGVLRDDFDGTQVDTSLWTVDVNAGSVAVAGSEIRVASPSVTSFPLLTTALMVIPQTGSFSVRWIAQYEQSTVHGTCSLVGSKGLPVDGGPNTSIGVFFACQDNLVGYNVHVATSSTNTRLAFSIPEGSLSRHDVEYCWLEDRLEVWVDGVRRLEAARDASVPAPDALWFGNYARGALNAPWSNFSLDVVEITAFDAGPRIFADGYETQP